MVVGFEIGDIWWLSVGSQSIEGRSVLEHLSVLALMAFEVSPV